jgi:hypothetical protein
VAVNGEAPTTAKPSSTILQAVGAGAVVKLEFTSEPQAVSAMTEAGQSSSVSASQSRAQAVQARDAQKMRRATELLEAWKLDPSELVHGDKVGAGGQADVYLGRWQVSSRTSQPISPPAASVRKPIPISLAGASRRDQEAARQRPAQDERGGAAFHHPGRAPGGACARARAPPERGPAVRSVRGAAALPRDGLRGRGRAGRRGARGP